MGNSIPEQNPPTTSVHKEIMMLGWNQFSAVLVLGAAVALPPVTASAQQAPAAAQARLLLM